MLIFFNKNERGTTNEVKCVNREQIKNTSKRCSQHSQKQIT